MYISSAVRVVRLVSAFGIEPFKDPAAHECRRLLAGSFSHFAELGQPLGRHAYGVDVIDLASCAASLHRAGRFVTACFGLGGLSRQDFADAAHCSSLWCRQPVSL